MCCCDYSAKYLYRTFRLAANDGGESRVARNTRPRNLRTRGQQRCVRTHTEPQRGLITHHGSEQGHLVPEVEQKMLFETEYGGFMSKMYFT